MSLETLIEAARFVEQQELHAKLQNVSPSPPLLPHTNTISIVTSTPSGIANSFKLISTSPTRQQQQPVEVHLQVNPGHLNNFGSHSLDVAARDDDNVINLLAGTDGGGTETIETVKMASAGPQVVEIVTKSLPLLNGFENKSTLLLPTTNTSVNQTDETFLDSQSKHFTLSPSAASAIIPTPTSKRHVAQNVQTILNAANNGPSMMRSGTREVHNKLEKNRRAHLKECFELLKKQLPPQQDEKKSSNLSILHSAIRFIQTLKKRERENEHEMERLAREKIAAQQRLAALKKELGSQWDNIDLNCLIPENGGVVQQTINASSTPPTLFIKDEALSPNSRAVTSSLPATQLSVLPLHTSAVGSTSSVAGSYHQVGQSLAVVGLHKLALVGSMSNGKSVQMVQSPVAHIITAPPQLNGKVVPLVNAQYLMKPVVVVSTPSAGNTALSPRQS